MSELLATGAVLRLAGLLAACVWVGGFVTITVVVRLARARLGPSDQIVLFRALGRAYGIVGGSALLIGLAAGAALLDDRGWDATALTAAGLGAALLVVTAAGVVQARAMTRLRVRAARCPHDAQLAASVRSRARRAAILRLAIGALTLAIVVLVAALA